MWRTSPFPTDPCLGAGTVVVVVVVVVVVGIMDVVREIMRLWTALELALSSMILILSFASDRITHMRTS